MTETDTLLSYLNAQRRHVKGILDGLDDVDLRRPILPTGWSCLGLVRHLALDVERFWFRGVIAGEPDVVAQIIGSADDAWLAPAGEPVLDHYQEEIDRANTIVAATPLDAAPAWWPADLFGGWRLNDVRQIVLHVITETATHAGHLDAARELIDGRTWLVLPV